MFCLKGSVRLCGWRRGLQKVLRVVAPELFLQPSYTGPLLRSFFSEDGAQLRNTLWGASAHTVKRSVLETGVLSFPVGRDRVKEN